ncbi:unnamed protein product [Chilo suppressalis]|uniref:Death domain-containing protein n=1 Tax=Chilo suppressalis TaxID=168631 RepID=A0ABN8BCM0_CHISP|nr:unnamed protein product [Chilo suppressalis]
MPGYSVLIEQVIKSFGESERHSESLSVLKELFRNDINSPRKYEKITSIGQLLRILEVRDVLSENNIQPLKVIALELSNNRLLGRIQEYEQSHVPVQCMNYYGQLAAAGENNLNSPQRQPLQSVSSNLNTAMSEQKIKRIKQALVEDIGTFWKDLARSLNIKESKIEEINDDYNKVTMKAKCVLEFYLENKADPQTWFYDICEALEYCKRKDLSKKLKRISVMNL